MSIRCSSRCDVIFQTGHSIIRNTRVTCIYVKRWFQESVALPMFILFDKLCKKKNPVFCHNFISDCFMFLLINAVNSILIEFLLNPNVCATV